jgi:hypothetical protein
VTSGLHGGRRFADSIPNRVSVQLFPLIFLNLSNGYLLIRHTFRVKKN